MCCWLRPPDLLAVCGLELSPQPASNVATTIEEKMERKIFMSASLRRAAEKAKLKLLWTTSYVSAQPRTKN